MKLKTELQKYALNVIVLKSQKFVKILEEPACCCVRFSYIKDITINTNAFLAKKVDYKSYSL